MLSYNNGKPFVIIRGGSKDGKILKIHDNTKTKENKNYDVDKLKQFSKEQLKLLKEALETGKTEYLTGKLKQHYYKIKSNDIGPSFHDDNAMVNILPTPDPDQRDSIYITGPSGAGKSTYISHFIEEYLKKYPKRPIIVFSGKPSDPALDKYNPIRIPLNENIVIDPIELDELENSLVIFDDIDQLHPKALQEAVHSLRDKILELGRSKGISICTVAHQITNYKASRICLNEADYCIVFPRSGQRYQANYFLKNYVGLDKDQIKKIYDIPSRSITIKKSYPMAIIYQNGCYVL